MRFPYHSHHFTPTHIFTEKDSDVVVVAAVVVVVVPAVVVVVVVIKS